MSRGVDPVVVVVCAEEDGSAARRREGKSRQLTEDERDVELFAGGEKVVDVVADFVVLEYEPVKPSEKRRVSSAELDGFKGGDHSPRLDTFRKLGVVLLEASESSGFVSVDASSLSSRSKVRVSRVRSSRGTTSASPTQGLT